MTGDAEKLAAFILDKSNNDKEDLTNVILEA